MVASCNSSIQYAAVPERRKATTRFCATVAHRDGGAMRKRATVETKFCPDCKTIKPVSDFNKGSNAKGLQPCCKKCGVIRARVRRTRRENGEIPTIYVTEKLCPNCNQLKPSSAFYKTFDRPNGLASWCKACSLLRCMANYEKVKKAAKPTVNSKLCIGCKSELPIAQFSKFSGSRDGYAARCRKCYGLRARSLRYGIPVSEFSEMIQKQDSKCSICKTKTERLHTDHCHRTGVVRGFLCSNCNTAIGLLKDSRTIVSSMLKYIEQFSLLSHENHPPKV